MDWQPIETAPLDGTGVILVDSTAEMPEAGMGWFLFGKWSAIDPDGAPEFEPDFYHAMVWVSPTHWMPIPPPPEPSHDCLLKLAEQIEAAEIGEQADALYNAWNALAPKFARAGLRDRARRFAILLEAPAYLSAAEMLVPRNHQWEVGWAGNSDAHVEALPDGPRFDGFAATPALALAAACCRAWAKASPRPPQPAP